MFDRATFQTGECLRPRGQRLDEGWQRSGVMQPLIAKIVAPAE
jgi:hypothetical protein